jgi:hypothetical protein
MKDGSGYVVFLMKMDEGLDYSDLRQKRWRID